MSKWKRWLCGKGLHLWQLSEPYQRPEGRNCCFYGIDWPVRVHPLDGSEPYEQTKHKCLTLRKRSCMYCGCQQEYTLDTMGHPTKDEFYWSQLRGPIPKAWAHSQKT